MQQHPRATSIAAAVAGRDGGRLGAALTDTVRLRALLPGGPVESHGRAAVVARFAGWFADYDAVELVSAEGEPVADRLLVHYRLDVRRGPTRWICTQTLMCKTAGDLLATVDLLCSGFREIDDIGGRRCVIRRSTRGAATTATTRSRCSRRVRAAGPVHEVTLPDGQRAWLVVRHAEARAALNDPRLSKDMHAALARDGAVVAEGLPGPAFARHMLSVDPPDHTRLRGLATAAFSRPRVAALRPAGPGHRRRPARRAAPPRRHRRRPGRGLRLPPAVHRDQRAARRPRTRPGRARGLVHHAAGARLGARTAAERGRGLGEHRAAT